MKTKLIAEVGINHNGSVAIAKKIIRAAKKIGVNIIKFQFYTTEKLILPNTPMAEYQTNNYDNKKISDQYKLLKKFELNLKQHINLSNYCKKLGLEYCCSFFHEDDVKYAKILGLKRIKIPSGELNNFFLLKKISKLNKKIILSTGMSNLKDLKKTLNFLTKNGQDKKKITILHCCSAYPTLPKDLNLNSISYMKKKFKKLSIGFSDHSKSIFTPMMAILKGAEIIEKHITLSNKSKGPDHKASLNIQDFKKMIDLIKLAEDSIGSMNKKIAFSEKKNIYFVKKSLVAKKEIKKGDKFNYNNLTAMRPLKGKSLDKLNLILGKKSKKNYQKNQII